jgi:formiminotetrahydrofolate cyclodeaminase
MEFDEVDKEELKAEFYDLMDIRYWGETEEANYKRVVNAYPKESEEDRNFLSWMDEAAFLKRVKRVE